MRRALTHDNAELGHVELYWEITDPRPETASLELIALRDLAAARIDRYEKGDVKDFRYCVYKWHDGRYDELYCPPGG